MTQGPLDKWIVFWRWKGQGGVFLEGWCLEQSPNGEMVRIGVYTYVRGDWFKLDEIEMIKK